MSQMTWIQCIAVLWCSEAVPANSWVKPTLNRKKVILKKDSQRPYSEQHSPTGSQLYPQKQTWLQSAGFAGFTDPI